jgi:hypothetical protein
MTFFYVVSIVFHASVPVLQKYMDTSRKKVFWLRVRPLVRRLLHLFEWFEDVKIPWGEYSGCGRHSKARSWNVATGEQAVWG